jgi:glycosidase
VSYFKPIQNIMHNTKSLVKTVLLLFIISISGYVLIACNEESETIVRDKDDNTDTIPDNSNAPFDKVPAIEDIVMYEVNIRAFSERGNFQGVIDGLDDIKNLGVNVIWLMPIYETAELNSVGSPYAVKDYHAVHSDFGTKSDLKRLVEEAHKKEMAVILDWVANHTAWDNAWITNDGWYATDGNGNIIHPPGTNWLDVAELNYNNTDMQQAMINAMKYWVEETNIDGYRCDFASGAPNNFWRTAIDTLRNIHEGDLILFAESDNKNLLGVGFDLIFGWPFYGKMKDVINNNHSSQTLITTHTSNYSSLAEGKHIVRWTTNHDENAWDNIPQHIFKNERGSVLAFVLTSYIGVVPLIYNGQEVGNLEQISFFEGNVNKVNWSTNPELKEEYTHILQFRNSSDALRKGEIQNYGNTDVLMLSKTIEDDEVLVIANVRNSEEELTLPSQYQNTTWVNAFNNEDFSLNTTITLDAFEYIVLD